MTVPSPRRWWALGVLTLCALIVDIDITILNIAAPSLAADLGADTADMQWIIDGYIVVLAALLLPLGLLGDRMGRKRVLLAGTAVFGAGSLLAVFAGDVGVLIAARALMGAGAAAVIPLSMSMLPAIFPPRERPRAMAIWAAAMVAGFPLGPMLGGFLLEHYRWSSVFLINLPVVAAVLLAGALLLPESRHRGAGGFRPVPTALVITGLAAVVYAVIEVPRLGAAHPGFWLPLAGGAGLLAAFAAGQLRSRTPMVDLRLFADPTFLWGSVAATYLSAAFTGAVFVLPQYLQAVMDDSTFTSGVRMLPLLAGLVLASLISERAPRRLGFRVTVVLGLLILAAGCALGAATTPASGFAYLALWTVPVGFGLGLALIPAMAAVIAALPPERAGVGSALITALRQVGSALGVAILGSVLSAVYVARLDTSGLTPSEAGTARGSITAAEELAARTGDAGLSAGAEAAFTAGMATVLALCAAAAVATAAVSARFLPGRLDPAGQRSESEDDLARTT